MHRSLRAVGIAVILAACSSHAAPAPAPAAGPLPSGSLQGGGTLARVYYWRAKPGKLAEYTRYTRDVAAPIDHEAQRRGAFLSITTYVAKDTTGPWTHMRIFILRDSAQLAGLSAALDAAGAALEPDSVKRRLRGEYSTTLRDAAGNAVLDILK